MREATVVSQRPEDSKDRVVSVSMGHYNVYFIQTDDGYILVDTGMPSGSRALQKAFSKAGIKPQDVKLIIITHAHPDHVGSVAHAKRVTGADVLCHEYAAPFIRAGKSSPIVAHSLMSKLLRTITPSKYKAVEPDIVITDEFDLRDFGIAGQVIHTPGHTQGSVAVLLENGEMLLGDLVRGTGVDIHIGSFYEDKEVLVQNLEKLAAYRANKIYMSHGDLTDNETLRQSIEAINRQRQTGQGGLGTASRSAVSHGIPLSRKDGEPFLERRESMTVQDTQPAGAEDTFKRALDNRLNAIGWGLFLVMLGGLWLASAEMVPEGTWLVGTGLIILGLGVVRYLNDIKVNWFWIGLGVLALGTGVGEIVGLSLPVFPILLIIAGVATLFRIFFAKEQG